jgi:hypothetical protein
MTEIGQVSGASTSFLADLDPTASGDLETVILALAMERSETLDKVIQGQIKDMQDRNAKIRELQEALQDLRNNSPSKDKKGHAFGQLKPETVNLLKEYGWIKDGTRTERYGPFKLQKREVPIYTGSFIYTDNKDEPLTFKLSGDGKLQQLFEHFKMEIDKQSSNSQLDMIKLQGLINKRNQSIEMMTNMLQKFHSLMEKIVGNMR